MCNAGMETTEDSRLIDELGGATKVAELLGYQRNGPQRVHNWRTRGIPPKVKLQRPDLFLRAVPVSSAPASTTEAQAYGRMSA